MNKQGKQTQSQRHRQQYAGYQMVGWWGIVKDKVGQTYGDGR